MEKIALLIGNTNRLIGTQKDMLDFRLFLQSPQGGAWNDTEIKGFVDEPASRVLSEIENIRNHGYDYVIIYFTGHGGVKEGTILQINPSNETIKEADLLGIAPKQITILDCCRSIIGDGAPIDEEHDFSNPEIHNAVRIEFEQLIDSAAPQQIRMYSCQEGESSYPYAGGQGSIYTQALIESAYVLLRSNDVVHVYECHDRAAQKTIAVTQNVHIDQHPEIVPAKCMSCMELPISFNPVCLKTK